MEIRHLEAGELGLLTELFEYNDPAEMIAQVSREINAGDVDIFVMFDGERPVGELHAAYRSKDKRTVFGRRAYLFAFRVHQEYQGRGLGKELLRYVLRDLAGRGYREFTVGVEDDNDKAKHIYESFGFTELIARKYEEYQGEGYEFGLYLKTGADL